MAHYLQKLVKRFKEGTPQGIFAVCSANEFVLASLMEFGRKHDAVVLVEATSNQVNQFGGYTGMVPVDFVNFVIGLAHRAGLPLDKLILGGDHLGPNPWRKEPAAEAMAKARVLVQEYVKAGFTKIHLDASMHLGDDGDRSVALPPELIAQRTAELCQAAEEAYAELITENPNAVQPVYVIGTEVPVPGGHQEELGELLPTPKEAARTTLETHRAAIEAAGLGDIWPRISALVVQPAVEFDHLKVVDYRSEGTVELRTVLDAEPNLVFEAHSTDYQTADAQIGRASCRERVSFLV